VLADLRIDHPDRDVKPSDLTDMDYQRSIQRQVNKSYVQNVNFMNRGFMQHFKLIKLIIWPKEMSSCVLFNEASSDPNIGTLIRV